MTNPNTHLNHSPITLSVMFSEAVYKAVVGVERIVRLIKK